MATRKSIALSKMDVRLNEGGGMFEKVSGMANESRSAVCRFEGLSYC